MVVAGLLPAAHARAFECKRSDKYDFVSLRWSQRQIQYGIRANASVELSHVQQAFAAWSAPDCTDLQFDFTRVIDPQETGVNQVAFIKSGWLTPPPNDSGEPRAPRPVDAVAVTLTTYTRDDGEIQSGLIEVNEERFQFLDAGEACNPSQEPEPYDLISVLTHEVGHFIGLDHTTFYDGSQTDPTMAPQVGVCELDKRTLAQDDIEALCLIYPSGLPPRSCDPLPSRTEYVKNQAFGCASAPPGEGPLWMLLPLVWFCWRRRWS